jgi:hypothetical protein
MPSAAVVPDGTLAYTLSTFSGQSRNSLTFQLSPRVSATFRYSRFDDVSFTDGVHGDRSFAVHFHVVDESSYRPSIAVGLNDVAGTGLYSSEYIVATKHLNQNLRFSVGLGWGRLAGVGSFDNPLAFLGEDWETRGPRQLSPTGGAFEPGKWFHGPAALFGGVEWQATDALRLAVEYSSDAYPYEDPYSFERASQLNYNVSYDVTEQLTASASWLYGSELGVRLTYAFDPAQSPFGTGLDAAPRPVRPIGSLQNSILPGDPYSATSRLLAREGLVLHGLTLRGSIARVEIQNPTYNVAAQAIGRTARVLTEVLPSSVSRFDIILLEAGVPVSEVMVSRASLEELEFALQGASMLRSQIRIEDGVGELQPLPEAYPNWNAAINPFLEPSFFDPDAPIRLAFGLDLDSSFEPAPGLILSGTIRQPLLGNLDDATRPSDSILPRVRSESNRYDAADGPTIPRLTAAWYAHPAESLYTRVTAGYLEPQFGGLSTEVLWMPNRGRVAWGLELNHVLQRDFNQRFGFRDYAVTTGHVSAYWDIGRGYHAQLDAGRYLAGDWGSTLTLDREFESGWTIGGFATLTDVSFDEFGEGSFDKGIRLSIPVSYLLGHARRDAIPLTLRPVLRDGGARLNVSGRLYDTLRDARGTEINDNWGRFWR